MNIFSRIFVAVSVVLVFFSQVYAEGDELRQVTILDVPAPSAQQVDQALFPPNIADHQKECAQMEKAGLRCQSVVPKSSMDSVAVTFSRGSATLSSDAKAFLKAVGESLQRHAGEFKSITIEGHADVTGNENSNRVLSKERAESVKDFLVANFGISNIETTGRGSDKLRDPAHPAAEINRRIEFVLDW